MFRVEEVVTWTRSRREIVLHAWQRPGYPVFVACRTRLGPVRLLPYEIQFRKATGMMQTCDECGGSLKDGYEVREHGRDENGYADEEILCGRCANKRVSIEPGTRTKMIIAGDLVHEWDGNAAVAFAQCFFEYPERIEIGHLRYVEGARW